MRIYNNYSLKYWFFCSMKGIFLFLSLCCSLSLIQAQTVWVSLLDKGEQEALLNTPDFCHCMLSERAIERRKKANVNCDWYDLPISQSYLQELSQLGELTKSSKWLNAVIIENADLSAIQSFPFVHSAFEIHQSEQPSWKEATLDYPSTTYAKPLQFTEVSPEEFYGYSYVQNQMLNLMPLNMKGNFAQDMLIAVFDAGFSRVDSMVVFDHARTSNKIIGAYDYVNTDEPQPYLHSSHGTSVLSTILAKSPLFVAAAHESSVVLYRTENGSSESIQEELNWAMAVEHADSMGVDITNTSLGYTTFDNEEENHSYSSLDGNTAPMTIAADIAASKGILVINSAGNSGNSPWYYIGVPADGDSVLAVGAVDIDEQVAAFSSRGPSFDGRVKPNVMAMGRNAVVFTPADQLTATNGTSFSGPILAAAAAVLWQEHPDASNMMVFKAIEFSSDRFANPNPDYGYGIPDIAYADQILKQIVELGEGNSNTLIFPNPVRNQLNVEVSTGENSQFEYQIFDISGKLVKSGLAAVLPNSISRIQISVQDLSAGQYILQLMGDTQISQSVIIKS